MGSDCMFWFETTLFMYIPCQYIHKSSSSFNWLHGVLLLGCKRRYLTNPLFLDIEAISHFGILNNATVNILRYNFLACSSDLFLRAYFPRSGINWTKGVHISELP